VEVWEENILPNSKGPESELIERSSQFFERLLPKEPYEIEIVCRRCGAALPK